MAGLEEFALETVPLTFQILRFAAANLSISLIRQPSECTGLPHYAIELRVGKSRGSANSGFYRSRQTMGFEPHYSVRQRAAIRIAHRDVHPSAS